MLTSTILIFVFALLLYLGGGVFLSIRRDLSRYKPELGLKGHKERGDDIIPGDFFDWEKRGVFLSRWWLAGFVILILFFFVLTTINLAVGVQG